MTIVLNQKFKGALDNILEFSFWLNFIYHVQVIVNLQIQKERFQKFLLKVKHA